MNINNMKADTISQIMKEFKGTCPECGKNHTSPIDEIIIESGAINRLKHVIDVSNRRSVYLLYDENTYKAAGKRVSEIIREMGIIPNEHMLKLKNGEPDEYAIGSAIAHLLPENDILIAVGSGVVNDIAKIVAKVKDMYYVIVGTAPSMDGYASATSSVIRDGVKISLSSKSADVIIGDLDVLCNAPFEMIQAGVGDMLAKYISIAEWRISKIINGEYYCDRIANLVLQALKIITDNIDKLNSRSPEAIKAVMEGLVISGIAANYAGISRPVSGVEHYISHIIDMRAVEFNTPSSLHGIQCGIATIYAAGIYEELKKYKPDKAKAISAVSRFSFSDWTEILKLELGKGAVPLIELEKKEQKYSKSKHRDRIDTIIDNWDKICEIIDTIPDKKTLTEMYSSINGPISFDQLGFDQGIENRAMLLSKDIRDKYVCSRLMWDLGIL